MEGGRKGVSFAGRGRGGGRDVFHKDTYGVTMKTLIAPRRDVEVNMRWRWRWVGWVGGARVCRVSIREAARPRKHAYLGKGGKLCLVPVVGPSLPLPVFSSFPVLSGMCMRHGSSRWQIRVRRGPVG